MAPGARRRRAARPSEGPGLPPPTTTHDYGLIGNLRTAALVHRSGAIDWACLPRFASPSVFARILDRRRGGTFLVRPVGAGPGVQHYRPSTNILETFFRRPDDGPVRVVDFMPVPEAETDEEAARIVRIAYAEGESTELELWFEPRFDYGKRPAELTLTPGGVVAASGGTSLALRGPAAFEVTEGVARATVAVPADASVAFDLSWGAAPRKGRVVHQLLEDTERFWRGWVHGPGAPLHRLAAPWHAPVERSELVLKLLSNAQTGAFVAAPTTSLPETPGGRRNWDYRYVWIRDAAFAAEEMVLLGHLAEARSFLGWVVQRLTEPEGRKRRDLRVMYGAHGESELRERELGHLAGFLGSRPVRVGNAASDQFQLDIYGELLNAAHLLASIDAPAITTATRRALFGLADEVEERWTRPDRGIWEVRGPPRHFVHSKVMAWVALDRAIRIAERYGGDRRISGWRRSANEVRAAVLERGWDGKARSFVRSFGDRSADAANLRIPLVGFLPFDDPRVRATVEAVRRELADGPFVYRYDAPDGLAGDDGSFLPCAFWLVECRARLGELKAARSDFERLLSTAGPLGLFSEEWDPKRRRPLGNYPQAFTHVALLRAALALGLATAPPARRAEIAITAPFLPGLAGAAPT